MRIRIADDLADAPQVQWVEPRLHRGFLWNSTREYAASCRAEHWGDDKGEDAYQFCHKHQADGLDVNVPLDNIQGFGFATSTELYQSGSARTASAAPEYTYRDPFVLYAQYTRPSRSGKMFMPLTFTSASKAEVVGLHGILTQIFIVQRPALKIAVRDAALREIEALNRERLRDRRAKVLQPSLEFEGRRFVHLHFLPAIEPEEGEEPVNREARPSEGWNVPEAVIDRQRRFRKIASCGFQDLVRRGESLFMIGKIIDFMDETAFEHADMIMVTMFAEDGIFHAYKPRETLKDIVVLSGADLAIPPAYMPYPDVAVDRSTRVLCAEFSDGEILPITQSDPALLLDFDKLRAELLDIARSAARGGPPSGISL
jgi:hypothetical protein